MSYFEKSYVLEILLAAIIILITALFPDKADKISNLLIVLYAGLMAFRLNQQRKEAKRYSGSYDKSAGWKNIFKQNNNRDEREKLIHLKANNFSLIITLLLLYTLFQFTQTLRITAFYYLFGSYLFLRGTVGLIYSRFIEVTG